MTLGVGAAGDAEKDASRAGACDPRVPQCGDAVLRATVWPQQLPETCQGAKASRRAWRAPPPERPARPSHLGPREPASEGLRGVRDFATQMKADPSRAA